MSGLDNRTVEESFPTCNPGVKPLGNCILLQVRTPMTQTSKGILLPEETRDTELWNTQVARVIDLGPLAFKNRKDLTIWPEGEWVKRGDYVRFKKYGGDRWMVPIEGKEGSTNASDCAMFILVEDVNISGKVTSHPNRIRGFI